MHMKNHIYVFPTSISVYLKSSAHTTNFTSNPEVHSNIFPFHICNTFLWEWETWLPLSSIHLHISSMSMTVASLLTPSRPALPLTRPSLDGLEPRLLPCVAAFLLQLSRSPDRRPPDSVASLALAAVFICSLSHSKLVYWLSWVIFFYALISIEIVTDIQ